MSCRIIALTYLVLGSALATSFDSNSNSTYYNPILPGFHPDPSCIFVPELDNTYFCASSSFTSFPGIPIHASKDLREWKLISNAISRPEQLPRLEKVTEPSGGLWAPGLRYYKGVFYLFTTLSNQNLPWEDPTRWENFYVTSTNPYRSSSWSKAEHFDFKGYDVTPFWDADGRTYIVGASPIPAGIFSSPIDLKTGKVGSLVNLWNGTGGEAPEGPRLFQRDGYYYLTIAEGGTFRGHFQTIARSRHLTGPYTSNPSNPILTNANTTRLFQAVGHADFFQDSRGRWWAAALSTRLAADNSAPIGRETVLTPASWKKGEWPVITKVEGKMSGWDIGPSRKVLGGEGTLANANHLLNFAPGSSLPIEMLFIRFPVEKNYVVSPRERPYSLRLQASTINISDLPATPGAVQSPTFLGLRQTYTYFTFKAQFEFDLQVAKQEVGVSVFQENVAHIDLSVILLPDSTGKLTYYFRVAGSTDLPVPIPYPPPALTPVPAAWRNQPVVLQIQARNHTHYDLSAWPAAKKSEVLNLGYSQAIGLGFKFSGVRLGAFATTNGGSKSFSTYVSEWSYVGDGQLLS
ncbi:glycosyl hydrolase [Cadophora sp. MPI-SDFR-AT-0126]|nr:glycosyl hydrolase [Leotiomycetes sp. MPI-SDFR-AT-0126]